MIKTTTSEILVATLKPSASSNVIPVTLAAIGMLILLLIVLVSVVATYMVKKRSSKRTQLSATNAAFNME